MSGHDDRFDGKVSYQEGSVDYYPAVPLNRTHKLAKGIYERNELQYHNWQHINKMLYLIPSEMSGIAGLSSLVDAIVWHDVFYVPGGIENERRSSDLFSILNPNATNVELVDSLIMTTRDHTLTLESSPLMDAENLILHEVMIDLDLYGLADPWQEYVATGKKIRQEFNVYDDEQFLEGRLKFIKRFLDKPFIFQSAFFSDREVAARHNLEKELYIIERIGKLPYAN